MKKTWKDFNIVVVDANGASRGLALISNSQEVLVNTFLVTKNSISTSFHHVGINFYGFISNVYEPQLTEQKLNLLGYIEWDEETFHGNHWILVGYFNMITFS